MREQANDKRAVRDPFQENTAGDFFFGIPDQDGYKKWQIQKEIKLAAHKLTLSGFLTSLSIKIIIRLDVPWNEALLKRSFTSFAKQTYPAYKIILLLPYEQRSKYRQVSSCYDGLKSLAFFVSGPNTGFVEALNEAVNRSDGDFFCCLEPGDVLAENALMKLAESVTTGPKFDFIYSDEDKIDTAGTCYQPRFKPDWSYFFQMGSDYINRACFFSKQSVESAGGFNPEAGDAFVYDMSLRANELGWKIYHIPDVLFHLHQPEEHLYRRYDADIAKKCLSRHLQRKKKDLSFYRPPIAMKFGFPFWQLADLSNKEEVDIIIPSKNCHDITRRCLESLLEKTLHQAYRIILVDNESDEPASRDYYQGISHPKIRVIRISSPKGKFSFSHLINQAAKQSTAPWMLLLNNDTEIIETEWLNRMLACGSFSEVGAVGAKLLFPDGNIQHAGVYLHDSQEGLPWHDYYLSDGNKHSFLFNADLDSERIAITAACMLVRRELFDRIGGFDAYNFGVAYNDVDFCLRLQDEGYKTIYCAGARLIHHESYSRGQVNEPNEGKAFKIRYAHAKNSYLNPNLKSDGSFCLSLPINDQ